MYLVVRNYKNIKGDHQEMSNIINSGFVPLVSNIKGFVDYYCLFSGENELTSVGIFEDEEGANESVKAAAEFVKEKLSQFFSEKPQIFEGEVFTEELHHQISRGQLKEDVHQGLS